MFQKHINKKSSKTYLFNYLFLCLCIYFSDFYFFFFNYFQLYYQHCYHQQHFVQLKVPSNYLRIRHQHCVILLQLGSFLSKGHCYVLLSLYKKLQLVVFKKQNDLKKIITRLTGINLYTHYTMGTRNQNYLFVHSSSR